MNYGMSGGRNYVVQERADFNIYGCCMLGCCEQAAGQTLTSLIVAVVTFSLLLG